MAVPSKSGAKDDLALHVREGSHVREGIPQRQTADEVRFDSGGLGEGQIIQIDGQT